MTLPEVMPEQRRVLEMIYAVYLESGEWPTHAWLEARLEREALELNRW